MIYKSPNPTKDGRLYYFRLKYKDLYGNTKDYSSKKYLTKKEAVKAEAIFKANNMDLKMSVANLTIQQIYDCYIDKIKSNVKVQSINKYNQMFNNAFTSIKDIKIESLDSVKYNQFIKTLDNYSTTTKNRIINLLRTLIRFSNKYYNTTDNLLRYIENFREPNKVKKDIDFYTYDEFLQYISVIPEDNWKVFFEVLYYLGLRKGEATALTWKDINFNKEEVSITKTLTTKLKGELYTLSSPKTKSSIRTLPIPKQVLKGLKNMQILASKKKYYSKDWFIFGDELPFRETTIARHNEKYSKLAGLKTISIHSFRHSCASFLVNYCNASIFLISKYLGHSSVEMTTSIYTHLYKNKLDEIKDIINKID